MIKSCLFVGFLAFSFIHGYASGEGHRSSLSLSGSDFHRYPARMLFTPDGTFIVAYRTSSTKNESSTLQIVAFDGRTGHQIGKHSYDVPSAGPAKISNGFVISPDGQSIYYVELTGNPVALEINTSTLGIVSESTARFFDSNDFRPRVEGATNNLLFLSAESKLPGKAVHIIALEGRDLSKKTIDKQIPESAGWGKSYVLSYGGDSLWMGSGKYWLKIGLESGRVEAKMNAQNDVNRLMAFSGGLVGMTNLSSKGFLQLFDRQGHQLRTLEEPHCGFVSVRLSPDEKDGAAVCEKTGTTEWSFGKTLERKAVVFDARTMASINSIPLSKLSFKTSIGTGDESLWFPQPAVYDSEHTIWMAVPEFSGIITLHAIPLSEHAQ
ncbi:MAG TPA: hypothetical protein VHX13_01750 [Acidobacteriaceae bacterium]|jgi:hypothetical protein|nr:hypothetical protein [Acidobacteriaceae bacterium]